jgi:hypothetical protein
VSVNSASSTNCPSCHSDQWKSARLVVLEGTSHSKGNLTGAMADPGKLSGRLSDIFLSDRWFSFEHPIALESEGVTFTAFAESIKAVLVVEGRRIPDAVRPADPPTPKEPVSASFFGIFEKVYTEPMPEPPKLSLPSPPVPVHWIKRLLSTYATMLLLTPLLLSFAYWGSTFVFDDGAIARLNEKFALVSNPLRDVLSLDDFGLDSFTSGRILVTLMMCLPVMLYYLADYTWGVRGINDLKQAAYEGRISALKAAHAKASKQTEDHAVDAVRHKKELEVYQDEMEKYKLATVANQLAHKEELYRVERARSLLWDRVRVCTRCANAYLGS